MVIFKFRPQFLCDQSYTERNSYESCVVFSGAFDPSKPLAKLIHF